VKTTLITCLIILLLWCASGVIAQEAQAAPSATAVGKTLKDILAEPQFHPEAGSSRLIERLVQPVSRAWNRLTRALRRLWERLFGFSGALSKSVAFQWAFICAFMVLSAYVLARILPSLLRKSSAAKNPPFGKAVKTEVARQFGADEWYKAAQEALTNGDYRRAIRCRYNEALARLDTARALRLRKGATNQILIRSLLTSRGPESAERLAETTSGFERYWYGENRAEATAYDQFGRMIDEMVQREKAAGGSHPERRS
jgi:hypothetical protein